MEKVSGKISENTKLNYSKIRLGNVKIKFEIYSKKKLKKRNKFFWGRVFYAYGP